MSDALIIINLFIFSLLLGILYLQKKRDVSFSLNVFTGLLLGVGFGFFIQFFYGPDASITNFSIDYINIIGEGYIHLLMMIVYPLVLISIISSILRVKDSRSIGKISLITLAVLLSTTLIAAIISIYISASFGLSAEGLIEGASEQARSEYLLNQLANISHQNFADMIINLIPNNPFLDLTGARPTSLIAVVIFAAFVGMAILGVIRMQPDYAEICITGVNAIHAIVMRLVKLVLLLTPYGVLAMMTKAIATSEPVHLLQLIQFIIASYLAIFLMFVVHLLYVMFVGLNPLTYLKKIIPVLIFAFSSRSSAGSIPLNVQTQTESLGVSEGIANFSASIGATAGQNGCAGIYPAMLAMMIAPTVGINPLDPAFIITLVLTITISSLGVAGVGGGATFAAIIVLSTLNLPVALVALLISIEPLIDMGRTALNVSASMLAGTVTGRIMKQLDIKIYSNLKKRIATS